jgi:dihydroorotate dehydrogenase electron transfer subunit
MVIENKEISANIFDMRLKCPSIASAAQIGQFITLYPASEKNLMPRPFSVCEANKKSGALRIVYEVKGAGTKLFSKLAPRETVKASGPMGNGYKIKQKDNIAIIGGGLGIPPLLWLTKSIVEQNVNSSLDVFLGYKDKVFLSEEFIKIKSGYNDVSVYVASESGAAPFRGNVVERAKSLGKKYDAIYSCGPKPALKAVVEYAKSMGAPSYISLEEKMACGFGACYGCAVKIKSENQESVYKRVCKDGPVFEGERAIFDD